MLFAALWIVFAVASIVQVYLRFGLGRRVPWGDEGEYLERARSADPLTPEPFLRPPLMTFFVLASGRSEFAARNALSLVAILIALVVAAAGYVSGGFGVAIACGLVYVFLPDRMVLSQHIKPDVLLALWHSLVLLLIVCAAEGPAFLVVGFGLLSTATILTRVDGIVVAFVLSLHPLVRESDMPVASLSVLWTPVIASLAIVSAFNARRYGRMLVDDTTLFNLTVVAREHDLAPGATVPVQAVLMPALFREWRRLTPAERADAGRRAARQIARQPLRFVRGVIERTWQMLGRDTFATQNLLAPETGAYPKMPGRLRSVFKRSLRFSFPLLVSLAAAGGVANPGEESYYLVVALATLVGVCLFHARTRFRYAILPELSLAAVAGLNALAHAPAELPALAAFLAVGAIALAAPPRRELPDDAPA